MACSNYPECKYIKSTKVKEDPVPTGEKCPECGHDLVQRKSRFGTTFVGCSNYPKMSLYQKKSLKKQKQKKRLRMKPRKLRKQLEKVLRKL